MNSSPARPLHWKFSQVLGDRAPGEELDHGDIISAIEFESKGDYLAIGDHSGRVILFYRTNDTEGAGYNIHEPQSRKEQEHSDYPASLLPQYAYKTEFQSHEPEFDYLTSLDIQEKINKLRWCASPNSSSFILSTNDRTIKLWKISEHKVMKIREMDENKQVHSENALLAEKSFLADPSELSAHNGYRLEWRSKKVKINTPTLQEDASMMIEIGKGASARCRRAYAHAHEYNINSLSNNSDGETFISADDLRVNLWNLEISNQCFNIIDMKPSDMEELVEVITSAEFHPNSCNLLAYSSSRGCVRLVDMRQSALCDQNARMFQNRKPAGPRSFFTEIIASISDMKFAVDGRHILTRDYMNLKLWDLRVESSPVAIFKVHEHLRAKLSDLYNSDAIFDKFDCCLNKDGSHFASGSYSNSFKVFSHESGHEAETILEASKNRTRLSHTQAGNRNTRLLTNFTHGHNRKGPDDDSNFAVLNATSSKLAHLSWHPTANLIACAVANSLYMYYA